MISGLHIHFRSVDRRGKHGATLMVEYTEFENCEIFIEDDLEREQELRNSEQANQGAQT